MGLLPRPVGLAPGDWGMRSQEEHLRRGRPHRRSPTVPRRGRAFQGYGLAGDWRTYRPHSPLWMLRTRSGPLEWEMARGVSEGLGPRWARSGTAQSGHLSSPGCGLPKHTHF